MWIYSGYVFLRRDNERNIFEFSYKIRHLGFGKHWTTYFTCFLLQINAWIYRQLAMTIIVGKSPQIWSPKFNNNSHNATTWHCKSPLRNPDATAGDTENFFSCSKKSYHKYDQNHMTCTLTCSSMNKITRISPFSSCFCAMIIYGCGCTRHFDTKLWNTHLSLIKLIERLLRQWKGKKEACLCRSVWWRSGCFSTCHPWL